MRSNPFGAEWRCAPTFHLRGNRNLLFRCRLGARWSKSKSGNTRLRVSHSAPNGFERICVSLNESKMAPSTFTILLFASLLCCVSSQAQTATQKPVSFNKFQWIATHNSYHIAPPAKMRALINSFAPGAGDALDYSFAPLGEQLDSGIRGLELDLYNDPQGGLYGDALARKLAGTKTDDEKALQTPGFKILHSPDFDVLTTVPTLRIALEQLRVWSEKHPGHAPILVQLELKTESFSAIKPPDFDEAALKHLESEIREQMPAQKLVTPDDVRGGAVTLRESVMTRGWPEMAQMRGKFLFALDNEDEIRDRYLALSPQRDLENRLCFVSVAPTHAAAAWMKRNDPNGDFEEIRALVAAGFVVRTRADADLKEMRAGDATRFHQALQSGAQWISTDAPETRVREFKGVY